MALGFNEQLIITIVDKFAIGLLIVGVGYFLNKLLETFKSEKNLEIESFKQDQTRNLENFKSQQTRELEEFKSLKALKNEIQKLKKSKLLEYREKQLSQYYWVLYMRLFIVKNIWKKINEDEKKDNDFFKLIRETILFEYEEITKVLASNTHLMEDDGELLLEIQSFLKHVSAFKSLNLEYNENNPIAALEEPFPENFHSKLSKTAYKLQKEYDKLVGVESSEIKQIKEQGEI